MSKPNRIEGIEWIHLFNGDQVHVPSEITRLGGTLNTIPSPPKPVRLINVDYIHMSDGFVIDLSQYTSSSTTAAGGVKPCRLINVDYIFDHHGNVLDLSLYKGPIAVTDLSATSAGYTQINLSWTATPVTDDYTIYYSTNNSSFTAITPNVTGTTYSHTGLSHSTTYYYYIIGHNTGGSSPQSNTASASTQTIARVTNLSATAVGYTQVDLSWSAAVDATSYTIYYSTNNISFSAISPNVTGTTYSHTPLSDGTTYYYYIVTNTAIGSSTPGNTASAYLPVQPKFGISGNDAMFSAGVDTNGFQNSDVVELKQFNSTATAVNHGLTAALADLAAGSDGSQVMTVGGFSSSWVTRCDMKQFASTATAVHHGLLTVAKDYLAVGSDGSQVMCGGGRNNNLNPNHYRIECEMKQFASTATGVNHGNLTEGRHSLAAGSDGSQVMFGGGVGTSGTQGGEWSIDMKQFSSTATAVDHGDLSQNRNVHTAGSDGTQTMFCGGATYQSPVYFYVDTCDLKQFSSTATAVDHGDLDVARGYVTAASDGTKVMVAAGRTNHTGPFYNSTANKQFSSSAIAVYNGNLIRTCNFPPAGASGN